MRLLALIPHSSAGHAASLVAQLASYRWLTRLGHIVTLVAVASLSPDPTETKERGLMPHVAIDTPFAVRQLVRLAIDTQSHAIVGVGDPEVDSVARGACDALGIRFLETLEETLDA